MSQSIPNSLDEWNFDRIKNLIDSRVVENDKLDFKFNLPDIETLTALCCSFANSQGGCIIFGIKDTASGFVIKGIDYDKEFGRKFGDKVRAIPTINYSMPKFIPMPNSNKFLIVVQIEHGELAPYVRSDIEKMKFWKRTNKGKEIMTLEEIRETFQKQLKQQLSVLYQQLATVSSQESDWIKSHKKFYVDRILSHYGILAKAYEELNNRVTSYLEKPNDRKADILKNTAEFFINQLGTFYYVAEGDFGEIKTVVNSPYLRDKFVLMVKTSIDFIVEYVTQDLIKTFYVKGFNKDKEVVKMWMMTIDQFIGLLKEELHWHYEAYFISYQLPSSDNGGVLLW